MILLDGEKLSREILADIKKQITELPFVPVFCDILVGDDKVSAQYVEMKARAARSVGIIFHKANFPTTITTEQLIREIEILNKTKNMCGIILQLPLPTHINTQLALDAVAPEIDVDCLGTVTAGKFYNGENSLSLPTALACLELLKSLPFNLKEKKVLVLGQGKLVGRPVTALLKQQGLQPLVADRKTENKETLMKQADIIISGIGKGKLITGDMIKPGAALIDAGTSEIDADIVGDVNVDSVKEVAGYVSPVPGGVGPLTVAMLLRNVLTVAQHKSSKNGNSSVK